MDLSILDPARTYSQGSQSEMAGSWAADSSLDRGIKKGGSFTNREME